MSFLSINLFTNKYLNFFETNADTYFSYNAINWFFYNNIITLFFLISFIVILSIFFKNTPQNIKILNLLSAYYLIIYFLNASLNFDYNFFTNFFLIHQNLTFFFNLFIFIAILTTFLFFLGVSNVFFIEENSKIEFSLLIWCILISAIYLISSTDFISIIILLECIAFSSYILVGFERKNKFSTTSALKYLLLASIPSGFFILGTTLLYNNYGTFVHEYLILIFESFLNIKYNLQTLFNLFQSNDLTDWFFDKIWIQHALENSLIAHLDMYLSWLNETLTLISPWIYLEKMISEKEMYILVDILFHNYNQDKKINPLWDLNLASKILLAWRAQFDASEVINMLEHELLVAKNILDITYSLLDESPNFKGFGNISQLQKENPKVYGIWCWLSWFTTAETLRFNLADAKALDDNIEHIRNIFEKSYDFPETLKKDDLFLDLKKCYLIIQLLHESLVNIFTLNFSYKNFYFTVSNNYELSSKFKLILDQVFNGSLFFDHISLATSIYEKTSDSILPVLSIFFPQSFSETPSFLVNTLYYKDIFLIIYLAIIFILINLAFKLTAAPFHLWAPSVYGGSPLATLTFLSIFSKITIIFFSIWLFINIFDGLANIWQPLILLCAFLSIFFSILGAFSEKFFKKFFIYSSIGHVGFMLIGIGVLNLNGLKGTVDYLILYILSSFIIWFIIMHLTKKTMTLINLKGLSLNYPFLSTIFSLTLFSLSGIPPLGGFFVKYEIFYSIIHSSFFLYGYILLLLTVISFFYYLRLIKIFYFENNKIFFLNKNLNDIKLRIISVCFFIIPFFLLYSDHSISIIIQNILKNSLF